MMEIHFTARNFDTTPALKSFTNEKMQKLEQRDNHIKNVNVIFQIEHSEHIAEANLHFLGADINATAKAKDMYTAIDLLVDKLLGQITKHKEKIAHR
jgi:putative sigma-54 modulation protein